MNRQYFVSYVLGLEGNNLAFGWDVVSRNKPIETDEDLKSIQKEIALKAKVGRDETIRIINWRRMEQE